MNELELKSEGITVRHAYRNVSPAVLYEHGVLQDGSEIVSSGAIATLSGEKTGRSPRDKRIVDRPEIHDDVWWGEINIPLPTRSFLINRQRAIDYLNTRKRVYVVDGFAGWDPIRRLKIRVICSRPYHALFMHNMLIRPTPDELARFGKPDYVIYNAGEFPADPNIDGVTSPTSVAIDFTSRQFVILGTQYAGEMKKGVFTIMHYLMPKHGILSMHCSANEGKRGDVSLFFGLSGTGKTTLSADPDRSLIGDDEHCWTDEGVFNIEGGCYAKCIHLSEEQEPEIYRAIRFGTVLENTVQDPETREVDFDDNSITENTRAAYPLEFIEGVKLPAVGAHPSNIIFLTCDAFGVLPPVSALTPEQAMYHFISGYTAKVAGTEVGVTEPQVTFSACFGAAFLVWHPVKYAELLARKMKQRGTRVWLVNTGWNGGSHADGARISLKYTRAIIDAIHEGTLHDAAYDEDPVFGLRIPRVVPGCPSELLHPREAWSDKAAYDRTAARLVELFRKNFEAYADAASEAVRKAGPRVPVSPEGTPIDPSQKEFHHDEG